MYLPQTRNESGDMSYHRILRNTMIAKLAFLLQIIVYGAMQIFKVQIVHGIALKHPFLLSNIVVTNLTCMLKHTLEYTTMQRYETIGTEVESL